MSFLVEQELRGIKQDTHNGELRNEVEKAEYEKKLRETYAQQIREMKEDPEKFTKEAITFTKKYRKKKKWAIWKENILKIIKKWDR